MSVFSQFQQISTQTTNIIFSSNPQATPLEQSPQAPNLRNLGNEKERENIRGIIDGGIINSFFQWVILGYFANSNLKGWEWASLVLF